MSQTLIAALDALEAKVGVLVQTVGKADPVAIGQKAEEGARRGASGATGEIGPAVRTLQQAISRLETAMPGAEKALERSKRVRWLIRAVLALAVVLGLLSAFVAGAAFVRSGLSMETEVGCRYLGGTWGNTVSGDLTCWRYAK